MRECLPMAWETGAQSQVESYQRLKKIALDASQMVLQIKNPYDFYKVLTFKWHMSKFEPNWIISLQITVI